MYWTLTVQSKGEGIEGPMTSLAVSNLTKNGLRHQWVLLKQCKFIAHLTTIVCRH